MSYREGLVCTTWKSSKKCNEKPCISLEKTGGPNSGPVSPIEILIAIPRLSHWAPKFVPRPPFVEAEGCEWV